MAGSSDDETTRYERIVMGNLAALRDFDLDALAEGIIAHRNGSVFHDNPYGNAATATLARLSWAFGWNERALSYG